nr:hypothetical protein [Tanacetum cinerariifolium]
SLRDKIICDLNKTPDLSQEPSRNCPKCGNPVDGQHCQGCALLRKKFKEDLFTYCIENGILQDSFEPSNDNTNVVNALQEPFVVKQDPEDIFCHQCTCKLYGKSAHYGYNCPPKVPIIPDPKPFNNQTIDELPQTLPSFDPTCYSEDGNSFTYDSTSNLVHDSSNDFNAPSQLPLYSCEFYGNDARCGHYCTPQVLFIYPKPCYNQDFNFPQDFHDFQQQYLCCQNCGELYHCNHTRGADNSLSMGDEHLHIIPATESDEFIKSSVENLVPNPSESEVEYECDVPACEDFTTLSNILFDAEKYQKIEMQLGIEEDDYDSERDIPVKDSDSFMEEIDLSFTPDDPMPLGIEEDDYDSERDILILEEFLGNDSLSLVENESFHFDIPSSSRPPTKPQDGNSGILNVKVMGDISEHKVPMPRVMLTLVPNQEKSPNLLSHQGDEASQPSTKCPMMIYGRNIPILDVPFLHFYLP